ncbi:hypothetical protein FIBSPDRAFT_950515 [Athelia psychrophila]|uniref:Uncharacterized protein n=1 Tax=Athelia psychrophila TaxID=1759441 RepID=A0A166NLM0_9AGAM|nr:hypothetical protein FIBSPDRAFT_950515 [Fibularhizoctonia sp. CBS 109695]
MTRHKQSKHGHPTRGEKGGVRVGHSVKTVADLKVGVQRVRKCHGRFTPYTRVAPSASSVYDVSPSAWCSSSESFEESPASLSPGYPLLSLSPPAQSSPEFSWKHDQPPFPQETADFQASGSSCDLDSSYLYRPDVPSAENQFDDFEAIQAMIDSIPDAHVAPPSSPADTWTPECTPPMTRSPTPSSDPLVCQSGPSPEEFTFFMEQLRSPEQVDRVRELDSWTGVSSDGAEFLNAPISQVAPGSLSVFSQQNQCLFF